MSIRPNLHSGKCSFWKKGFRGNVHSAKCKFWQVYVQGNVFLESVFKGNVLSGRCKDTEKDFAKNITCRLTTRPTKKIKTSKILCLNFGAICNYCNYMFIHQVTLGTIQRRDLSAFESSCQLPSCIPHTVE